MSAVYQERTFTIAAGDAVDWNRHGDAFGCLEATGDFFVKLDNQPRTQFRSGLTLETETKIIDSVPTKVPFNSVRIENRGDDAISVTVFATKGKLRDARLTLEGDLQAFIRDGDETTFRRLEIASGERVQIAPANPLRSELVIANIGLAPVYIGDAEVSFWGANMPIAAGHTFTIKTPVEFWAYAQAAGTQTLQIMENTR